MRDLGKKRKRISVFKILIASATLTILTIISIKFFNLDKYIFKGPATVIQLITNTGLKSDNGRVNVLLLGIGGQGHEGPDLTDTIILASIDKDGKDVALISIPRDLWVQSLSAKINHAYAYGEEKDKKGLQAAKNAVSTIFGIPVHYAARVDFNGFIKATDLVGGLNIEVENSFTDPKYPISGKEDDLCGLTIEVREIDGVSQKVAKDATGSAIPLDKINDENDPFTCRFETLKFTKGPTHMDGTTTLKFVRSRHGTNDEGSDFARSARQQKVILGLRQEVLSAQTLLNPKTIIELISTFGDSIDTDIKNEEIPLLVRLGKKIEPQDVRRVVLDAGREPSVLDYGIPQNFQGQSVLVPKSGSWTDLAEYVQGEIFALNERK